MIFKWNKLRSLCAYKTGIVACFSIRFMNGIKCYSQCRELTHHDCSLFNTKLIGYTNTSDCNKTANKYTHEQRNWKLDLQHIEMNVCRSWLQLLRCVTNRILPSWIINMSKIAFVCRPFGIPLHVNFNFIDSRMWMWSSNVPDSRTCYIKKTPLFTTSPAIQFNWSYRITCYTMETYKSFRFSFSFSFKNDTWKSKWSAFQSTIE